MGAEKKILVRKKSLDSKLDISPGKGKRFAILLMLFLAFDQLSKALASRLIGAGGQADIIRGFFSISNYTNTGMMFGLLPNTANLLVWLSLVAIGLIIYMFSSLSEEKFGIIGSSLMLAGIMGNLIDRLLFGRVTDMIYFHFWPAFNVADSCLCIGVFLLFIGMLMSPGKDKKKFIRLKPKDIKRKKKG